MVSKTYETFLVGHLGAHEVRHSGRSFFTHLKGTHDLLRDWGNPEPVCVAGLFHSIYGTWHFRHKAFPIENRDAIRDLIGDEAEFYAYVFCVTERPKDFLANARAHEILIKDHYAGCTVALSADEMNCLLEIETANLLEQGGNIEALLDQLIATDISHAAKLNIRTYSANLFDRFGRVKKA